MKKNFIINNEINTTINETEVKPSIEHESMEEELTFKTVKANINGKVENIILGYSIYNMERPKDKADLISLIDKEKILDVIFHLGNADIFWNEGIELKDANGNIIPKDTPNVFVPCDTSDTYWRFEVNEILQNVEIHKFSSLQEYGQAIGNTTLYSRKPNNVELLGFAAIASKNPTYNSIYNFAKKYKIPMNTAMQFYGIKLKQSQTMQLVLGMNVKGIPAIKRTKEQAETLIETTEVVFGKKETGKRYAINSINAVINKYDLDTVIAALEQIPASTITTYKLSECHEKESCLVAELVLFIEEMNKRKAA